MAPRFKFFLAVLLLVFSPLVFGEDAPSAEPSEVQTAGPNSDALEMISKRMQSLTNSLQGMPQPPKFDQKIQLPDSIIKLPPPAHKGNDENFENLDDLDNSDNYDNPDNTSEKEN